MKAATPGDMQPIGQCAHFASAIGFVSQAERSGGGLVYAAGWETKAGWT